MSCDKIEQLQAYHDGQLLPVEQVAMETHLQTCAACQKELAELRSLSDLLQQVSLPDADGAMFARFHESVESAKESTILRFTEWLTAAAAVVLVGGLSMLFMSQTTPVTASPNTTPNQWAEFAMGITAEQTSTTDTSQWAILMTGETRDKSE